MINKKYMHNLVHSKVKIWESTRWWSLSQLLTLPFNFLLTFIHLGEREGGREGGNHHHHPATARGVRARFHDGTGTEMRGMQIPRESWWWWRWWRGDGGRRVIDYWWPSIPSPPSEGRKEGRRNRSPASSCSVTDWRELVVEGRKDFQSIFCCIFLASMPQRYRIETTPTEGNKPEVEEEDRR